MIKRQTAEFHRKEKNTGVYVVCISEHLKEKKKKKEAFH